MPRGRCLVFDRNFDFNQSRDSLDRCHTIVTAYFFFFLAVGGGLLSGSTAIGRYHDGSMLEHYGIPG